MTLWGYPVALSALAGRRVAGCKRGVPLPPDTSGGQWLLLQGYGRHGEVVFQWHYIDVRRQERDVRNYHGFHTPGQ
jgi:hypothetical protein